MYYLDEAATSRTRSWVFGRREQNGTDTEPKIYWDKRSLGDLSRPYSNYSDQNPDIPQVMSFFGSEETLSEAVSIITDSVSQLFPYFMHRTCGSTVLQYI